MKYLIGNQVINGDHITLVKYFSADETTSEKSSCLISTDDPSVPQGEWTLVLSGISADRFWEIYSSDAYMVVTK